MASLITAALDPVLTDTTVFVNRTEDVSRLLEMLETYLSSRLSKRRVVLWGEKGIGKTILTRKVLEELERRLQYTLIRIEVEGRGLGYRGSLKRIARELAREGLAWLKTLRDPGPPKGSIPLERLFHELGVLAGTDTITEGDTSAVARQFGADVGIEGGLFGLLQGRGLFRWSETRQHGQNIARTQTVTDELLHDAIQLALSELAGQQVPCLLFFNDLDQLLPREHPDQLRQALGQLVALEPCVQIVNIRPEVLYDDLRRESKLYQISALRPDDLLLIFDGRRRLEIRPEQSKKFQDSSVQALATALSRLTGNPYVYLKWMEEALQRTWPPPPLSRSLLQDIVTRDYGFVDRTLMLRAIEVVDRVAPGRDGWAMREDLERGRLNTDTGSARGLDPREIDRLIEYSVLVPRDVFQEDRGLRLDPLLDVLRPSILAALPA